MNCSIGLERLSCSGADTRGAHWVRQTIAEKRHRASSSLETFLSVRTNAKHRDGKMWGDITSAAFARDETLIVAAYGDGRARIWDARTGALLNTVLGHAETWVTAVVTPDGNRVLIVSGLGSAELWTFSRAPNSLVLKATKTQSLLLPFVGTEGVSSLGRRTSRRDYGMQITGRCSPRSRGIRS